MERGEAAAERDRSMETLDDDEADEKKSVSAAAAAAAAGEADPLDAFMATLAPSKKQKPAAAAAPAPTASAAAAEEEEIDPLDSFMASLNAPAASSGRSDTNRAAAAAAQKRLELDDEDTHASYLASSERRAAQRLTKLEARAGERGVSLETLLAQEERSGGGGGGGGGRYGLDSDGDDDDADRESDDGRPSRPATGAGGAADSKKREVKSLAPLDHSAVAYAPFRKNFYTEHAELASMPEAEMAELTADFDVQVSGPLRPRLCYRWEHFGFPPALLAVIRKQGFESPTPIQAQSIPCALLGLDLIGIGKTGSGKTAAFLWPMIVHMLDQPPLQRGEGPIGLILAPTRELAEQIYQEAYRYLRPFQLRVTPVMGGMQKFQQQKSLQEGTDVVVCTPGRFVDLLASKACSCARVTFLVLDEADRMFSMGFEGQVRSIVGQIRPDRQTLLFSATFHPRVEALAREALRDPVRIMVGSGGANKSIRQVVDVLPSADAKWGWLQQHLPAFLSAGAVLIFCATIASVDDLARKLGQVKIPVGTLHGDHHQAQRQATMAKFKAGQLQVLVATDVAARGLDIKGLPTVVNFDVARSVDAHTHRIGRTGRAGKDGIAYTLLVAPADQKYAGMLLENLEEAEQEVPTPLWELAMKDNAWARGRAAAAVRGRGGGRGGAGGGRGGGAPSYNNVPPPSMGRSFVPARAPHPPPPPPPFPSSVHGAHAFADAYRPAAPMGAAPAAAPNAPATGSVHPSRLAQIPGAAAAAAAAALAASYAHPAAPAAYAASSSPSLPPPSFTAHGSAVHPSRMGQVPQSAGAMPPVTAAYGGSGALPLPPPPPPSAAAASAPTAAPSAAATSGTVPPPRKSRWGN